MTGTRILSEQEVEALRAGVDATIRMNRGWQTSGDSSALRLADSHEALRAKLAEAEAELATLREGIDRGLNIADYDDADRIHEVAECHQRKMKFVMELGKCEATLATVTQERNALQRDVDLQRDRAEVAEHAMQQRSMHIEHLEAALAHQTARAERLEGALRGLERFNCDCLPYRAGDERKRPDDSDGPNSMYLQRWVVLAEDIDSALTPADAPKETT